MINCCKNRFSSKKQMLLSLGSSYFASVTLILLSISFYSQFQRYGNINLHEGIIDTGILVGGNDAKFTIMGVFTVTLILAIYSIYLTGCGVLFLCRKDFDESRKSKPEYAMQLICPKCEEAFNINDVEETECPSCRTSLENLEGYYERHPNLRDNKSLKNDVLEQSLS